MSQFREVLTALSEQMKAELGRTDVLRPATWLFGISLTALTGMSFSQAPFWLLVFMTVMCGSFGLLAGISYAFCLVKDRDALRSEKYQLHKLAIERGLLGDSKAGLIEIEDVKALPQLNASDDKEATKP